jgi:predicted enzyme related to lactoylglutathione lyase
VTPYVETPYYVGFRIGEFEVGLDPNGTAVVAYRTVLNIVTSLAQLLEAGATEVQGIRDVGDGLLIATAQDSSGNLVGLRQFPN